MNTYSKSLVMVFSIGIITQGTLNAEGFWDRFKPTPEFWDKVGYRSEPRDYGSVPEYKEANMFDLYQNQRQDPYQAREQEIEQKMIEHAKRSKRFSGAPDRKHSFKEENFALRQTPGKWFREFEVNEDAFRTIPYKIEEDDREYAGPFTTYVEPTQIEGKMSTAPCPPIEGHLPSNRSSCDPAYRSGFYGIPYTVIKKKGRVAFMRKTNALEDKLMSLDLEIRDLRDKQDEIRQMLFTPQQYDY
jgi:hypothetical protein